MKNQINSSSDNESFSILDTNLNKNILYLENIFTDCPDVVYQSFIVNNTKLYMVYLSGFVNDESIPLQTLKLLLETNTNILDDNLISTTPIIETSEMQNVVSEILDGHLVVIIDKESKALIFKTNGGAYRQVSEPSSEAVIRGSKDGFIENLSTNIVLIRQKIRSTKLKIIQKKLGDLTQTSVAIVYLDHLVNREILEELQKRLDLIKIDGVLESEYVEEFIEDNPLSPFSQIQNTERPDSVVASLLEGRISVLLDGSPSALIVPTTFWQLLQSSEDYYHRFYFSTFIRLLRFISVLTTLLLPSMYIALSTFQIELIPTTMLLTLMASREKVPFPALIEALTMEVTFEALREAGVRLPKLIGQTVSILGAIVIGTAAVQAGIVSAPMVIVTSITGIAASIIPKANIGDTLRLLRFPLMLLAGTLGLFGISVGIVIIAAHLCSLRTFGMPFMKPIAPFSLLEQKDVLIRAPLWLSTIRQNKSTWRYHLFKKGRM
ncbi:spore germination protein [Cohnella sp. JJ-181]|uniref:spore germination protein n=1 Tax=Cohnella rhizoplanae TaxID=2974897 RepID=UPI0022FF6ADC|nr:spore germination protein [Cohnella sp. JJ-181]CAI6087687.1 Spore germination protein A1 [Cohnella sp. JJ-181]